MCGSIENMLTVQRDWFLKIIVFKNAESIFYTLIKSKVFKQIENFFMNIKECNIKISLFPLLI